MQSALQVTDSAAAVNAVAPRVRLADIEAAIAKRYDLTAAEAVRDPSAPAALAVLSICFIVMTNGFIVIGKSAPAAPENFVPELGRKFAYEDAVRQLWPLMGFALRDRLSRADEGPSQ